IVDHYRDSCHESSGMSPTFPQLRGPRARRGAGSAPRLACGACASGPLTERVIDVEGGPMPASPSPDPAAQAVDDWRQRGRMIAAGPDGEAVFVVEVPGPGTPDGPPLLVLHGFPSNCFDWRHVVGDLAAQRPVVLFDFLGFGLSD